MNARGDFRQWGRLAFKKAARTASHLALNPANSVAALLLDVDRPDVARIAWDTGRVPRPTWFRHDLDTGRGHAGYVLAAGVHRNRASSLPALGFLADVERSIVLRTGSDPAFSASGLTRNPWIRSLFEATDWGRLEGRSLADLVPQGGILPARAGEPLTGEGRNVSTFRACLVEAEALAWALRRGDPGADVRPILPALRAFVDGMAYGFPFPLGASERAGIVRSVMRYALRWTHGRRRAAVRSAERTNCLRWRSAEVLEARAERDVQILRLRAEGRTLRAIAAAVGVSPMTAQRVCISRVQG